MAPPTSTLLTKTKTDNHLDVSDQLLINTNNNNNNVTTNLTTGAVPKQPTLTTSNRQQQQKDRETIRTLNELLYRACLTNNASNNTNHHRQRGGRGQRPGPVPPPGSSSLEQSFEVTDNLQEQQRYRFPPVRPVQRVQHQQHQNRLRQTTTATTTTTAAVGVVIPNNKSNDKDDEQHQQQQQQQQQPQTPVSGFQGIVNRLFDSTTSRSQIEVLRLLLGFDENSNSNNTGALINQTSSSSSSGMVHEINPNHHQHHHDGGVVNSTSLEDVALSEMSDNRAQSIQSLHSVLDTPTLEESPTTPSFDELQQRLDASNRNMQHLQEEQAKLQHIQQLAKTHLNEMEQLRQQAGQLPNCSGSGDAPNYESVQQVQMDMSALVGRMKNLTAFIHNQNELSSVLGDDGPEILAEQQALQEKLEALRLQRDDMRHLVDELNSINRTASETSQTVRRSLEKAPSDDTIEASPPPPPAPPAAASQPSSSSSNRTVPVEYHRNVPILRQEAANAAERALHAQQMINKKTADIEALKSQMARLKNMLTTVTQIEDNTPSMGQVLERQQQQQRRSPDNANIAHRVHALNDVTSELRAETATLQQERDRIIALKQEIERRKQQAAAAVQMGEEALKRSSLTPTPTPTPVPTLVRPSPTQDSLRAECVRLKNEYEQKQRAFEARYKPTRETTDDDDEDDANDDDTEEDSGKYFGHARSGSNATMKGHGQVTATATSNSVSADHQQQQQQHHHHQQHLQQQQQHQQELNVTMDNDSLQSSGSTTQSQFIPPPMPSMPLPPSSVQSNWNSHNWPPTLSTTSGNNITTSTATTLSYPDNVLLQQFMQTQQMLINSVCQCNQTLWHQQREIDNLNSQLHALQERVNSNDGTFSLRSESVPPSQGPPTAPSMLNMPPNNICMGGGGSRAQSEQLYNCSAFANYHQQHRSRHSYGLNNAAPPPPPNVAPPVATHFNNETPLSPSVYRASPGPIFMNHHNNMIHQNNANLRTQNHHANNQQQHQHHHHQAQPQQQQQQQSEVTLNNQVPPGNRANNYWDNFRSYSRQNLLSINNNSSKSNEELDLEQQYRQMQQQQQQQATRSRYDHRYDEHLTAAAAAAAAAAPPLPPPTTTSTASTAASAAATTSSSHRRPYYNLNNIATGDWLNLESDSNNLSNNDNNSELLFNARRRNHRRLLPTLRDCLSSIDDDVDSNQQGQQQQPPHQHEFVTNLNVNSPQYQRNKLPAKPTTSAVALTPHQQRQLRFDFDLPAVAAAAAAAGAQTSFDYLPPFPPPPPSLPPPPPPPQLFNVTTTTTTHHHDVAASAAVDEDQLEQSEDTASEELNRNLLVNALKNDKFTTKFYESIKEDVYRRLETLFEQQQQQHHHQQQQQLELAPSSSSPTPSLPLPSLMSLKASNEQPIAMKLEQRESSSTPPSTTTTTTNEVEQKRVVDDEEEEEEGDENDCPEDDDDANQQPSSSSASSQSTNAAMDNEEKIIVTLIKRETPSPAAATASTSTTAIAAAAAAASSSSLATTTSSSLSSVKIKAPPPPCSPPSIPIEFAPDYELIEYIINRIRNQTHSNTIINDSMLGEVSKLTANAAHNSSQPPLISPKRIYAKIKKMDIPRNRDEFLTWYRTYLEQLFVVEIVGVANNNSSNTKKKKTINERIRVQSQSQDSNDADLAEADQREGKSTAAAATTTSATKSTNVRECENDENPEEEGATAASSSINGNSD